MLNASGTTAAGTVSGVLAPMPVGAPSVQHSSARWWILAGLLGLMCASADGLLVAVGVRLRGTTTAVRTAETGLGSPAPGPGRPEVRAEDDPAAPPQPDEAAPKAAAPSGPTQPAEGGANPPPRASMLLDPRSLPARPAVDPGVLRQGILRQRSSDLLGPSSSPGGGSRMTPAATAATASDPSTTPPRAWTATTWAHPAARGPPTETSSSPPASATSAHPESRRVSGPGPAACS